VETLLHLKLGIGNSHLEKWESWIWIKDFGIFYPKSFGKQANAELKSSIDRE
jgi:hypothetical protein